MICMIKSDIPQSVSYTKLCKNMTVHATCFNNE